MKKANIWRLVAELLRLVAAFLAGSAGGSGLIS